MPLLSPLADLYSDYLIVNQGQATATELSSLVEGNYSHDSVTRMLHQCNYTSADLWKYVKPMVREKQSSNGVLIFDDTIEEKAYMDENAMICWHYDHCLKRNVKGINQLTALYYSQDFSCPVAFTTIHKTETVIDKKTKKPKRICPVSKHEYVRSMFDVCLTNHLKFSYVLGDAWYSCAQTMQHIHQNNSHFIFPLKANRKIAFDKQDQQRGHFQSIESLSWEEHQSRTIWLEDLDFPLILTRQVFKNKDESEGVLYLTTNDLTRYAAHIFEVH
jgi:hypothetical protein